MRFNGINIPTPLIDAQVNGSLIIFAGAGVSMSPPSGLPSFVGLTQTLSKGTELKCGESEPLDSFLGRLYDHGVKIHSLTKQIIGNPDSKPSQLHKSIVMLFNSIDDLKIVTTNFDNHFSTFAQKEMSPHSFETYYAPALPLGKEFSGIIYLHGTVKDPANRLILTDSDFGKAYLTDGWATRFLLEMFQTFTVLFVGYSHNDPVMNYLARGLTQTAKGNRYAFCEEGQEDHWRYRGIEPISYALDGDGKHTRVEKATSAWAEHIRRGALEQESRVKEIVSLPPPLEHGILDEIKYALDNISTLRFFTRHAKTLDWLRFVEKEGKLKSLFQLGDSLDEKAVQIAGWLAETFVCQYPDAVIALVERQGQIMNPVLWRNIGSQLWIKPRPTQETISKWVSVLLRYPPPSEHQTNILEYLFQESKGSDENEFGVLLFEYLFRPRLKLRAHFDFEGKDPKSEETFGAEIVLNGNVEQLRPTWKKRFRTNLKKLHIFLESVVTSHLISAHLLLRGAGRADENWDIMSYHRSAIESHPQDQYPDDFDALIDVARDIIEYLVQNDKNKAAILIESWASSGVPLLIRLAIHGVTENTNTTPENRIKWIVEKKLLFWLGSKHEVFRLLKLAYPGADNKTRIMLVKNIRRGPPLENIDQRNFAVYNLLLWLQSASADCQLLSKQVETINKMYPDFIAEEHPDFSHWIGPTKYGSSFGLIDVEDVLSKNPNNSIDYEWLLEFKEDHWQARREDALTHIIFAASKNFSWSWKFTGALTRKKNWRADVWRALIQGWHQAKLNKKQWNYIIKLLLQNPELYWLHEQISTLFYDGIKEKDGGLPEDCLAMATEVVDKIWQHAARTVDPIKETHGLFGIALNHTGGKLTLFWLSTLFMARAKKKKTWKGLPEEDKKRLRRVLTGKSTLAVLGRIILASEIKFLFSLDQKWTSRNVVPLLDWSIDAVRALHGWQGYLYWGHWHPALLPQLIPLFDQTFDQQSELSSDLRDRFGEHIANLAIFGLDNPLNDGWLGRYLLKVNDEARANWASKLREQMDPLSFDAKKKLWRRWLSEYWLNRINGIPLPLGDSETVKMIEWCPVLSPVFPEVVELIVKIEKPDVQQTRLYYELEKMEFAETQPFSLSKLLLHLLKTAQELSWHHKEIDGMVRRMAESEAPTENLQAICDELARLGYKNAAQLKNYVQNTHKK